MPQELRSRLVDAEVYHQVLDHLWLLSENEGRDVGLEAATASYIETVLRQQPSERVVLDTEQ